MPKTNYSPRTQALIDQATQEYHEEWGLIPLDDDLAQVAIEYKKTSRRKEWFVIGRDGLIRLGHSGNGGSREEQATEALNNARVHRDQLPLVYLKRPATAFHIPERAANAVKDAFRADFGVNAEHNFRLLEKRIRTTEFQKLEKFLIPEALAMAEKMCSYNWNTCSTKDVTVYSYNACAGSAALAGSCSTVPLVERSVRRIIALNEFIKFDRYLLH